MQEYYIESTKLTPSMYFNPQRRLLDIRGMSISDRPLDFYNRIYDYMDEYAKSGNTEMTANFAFKHLNTSSSKCVYLLFKRLDKMSISGKNIAVNWYYQSDDENMLNFGSSFNDLFNIEINVIKVSKENPSTVGKPEATECAVA